MAVFRRLAGALRALLRPTRTEQELDDELRAYLDAAIEEKVAGGLTRAVAERAARVETGSLAAVKDYTRDAGWEAWVSSIAQDVRYAVRGLRASPGFALAVVLTLGLGIGVNTAVFSVADAALFKPLPYRDPHQLVELQYIFKRGTAEQYGQLGMPWRQLGGWRAQTQLFSGIETYGGPRPAAIGTGSASTETLVSRMSPGLMPLLGLSPIVGRAFRPDDAQQPAQVVLLGQRYWKRRLDADPEVVGKELMVDGRTYTVVGVAPASLSWRVDGRKVAVWLPLDEVSERQSSGPFVAAIARIRSHLSTEEANHELDRAAAALDAVSPDTLLRDVDLASIDTIGGPTSPVTIALETVMGAVGIVLLIACANVANLLLSRNLARRREIALRAALGATRFRQLRQMLTEGLVLAAIGGLVAVGFVWMSMAVLPILIPEEFQLFEASLPTLDVRTFLVAAFLVIVTGLVCSVLPAVHSLGTAARAASLAADRSRVVGAGRQGRRLQGAFQTIQVAFALVLLTVAGLLTTSLVRMVRADAGYDVDRLAAITVASAGTGAADRVGDIDDFLSRLNALPGVRAAYGHPPVSAFHGYFVPFERQDDGRDPRWTLDLFRGGDGYLDVVGIPLKAGRNLNAGDIASAVPVALIDDRTAARHWPGQSALGQRFRYSPHAPWLTVVGVVAHVKTARFAAPEGSEQVYLPMGQWPLAEREPRPLVIRTAGDPADVIGLVQRLARERFPALMIEDARVVSAMYGPAFVLPRFALILMLILAGLALLTASVGLYGVLAFAVNQRTPEIGVRMALGASARQVRRLVVRDAIAPVGLGVAAGLVATLGLSRFIATLLYDTPPHDPWTLLGVTVIVVAVAVLASSVPARRASRVDPAIALRAE